MLLPAPLPTTPASPSRVTSSSRKKGLPPLRSSRAAARARVERLAGQLARAAAAEASAVSASRVSTTRLWRPCGGCQRSSIARRAVASTTKRRGAQALEQRVDELEDDVVGPVEVGQHHDDRALHGEALDEGDRRVGGLLAGPRGSMPRSSDS